MGVSVSGSKPTTKRGEGFYANLINWSYVAAYCDVVAPDMFAGREDWSYNYVGGPEGPFGLDAAGATALADVLEAEIKTGRTATFLGELDYSEEKVNSIVNLYEAFADFLRESGGITIT